MLSGKRRVSSDQVISVVHIAACDDCSHVAPNALISAQTCPGPGCDYADVAFGQPGRILARRSFRFAIALGTTWWLVVVVARSLRLVSVDLTTLLMMLGVAVTVPLALHVALEPASRPLLLLAWIQPAGAAMVGLALVLPAGGIPAALTIPWGVTAAICFWAGFHRLRRRGIAIPAEVCIDAGLLYLSVGWLWLFMNRTGIALPYSPDLLLRTAIHFHFAGFAGAIMCGASGRFLADRQRGALRAFRWTAFAFVVGPALVGLGIAFSKVLEVAATLVLAAGLVTLAVIVLGAIAPVTKGLVRALLLTSSLSSIAAMGLAVLYVIGEATHRPVIGIGTMVATHGVLNGAGFATAGLAAWVALAPPSSPAGAALPFSKLRGGWHVGPQFFVASNSLDSQSPAPHGIVDNLRSYDRPGFRVDAVHPAVRAFYERTAFHGLEVTAEWRPALRPLARLYRLLSARVEQVNLPGPGQETEPVDSIIVPLSERRDGRAGVRGWIRTYRQTGRAIYVAAYANSRIGSATFMNIAFPLPGGSLTSVLSVDYHRERAGGVMLTTRPDPGRGPQGVYYANSLMPIRLPVNETIAVYAVDNLAGDGVHVEARHDVWVLGLAVLTLRYFIVPSEAAR